MKFIKLDNFSLYKEKTSNYIDNSIVFADEAGVNNIFKNKHDYIIKFKPYNATAYPNFGNLREVRLYTENNTHHLTLNSWISRTRLLSTATMKSTNPESTDIFNLKISTPAVYTDTDNYQTYRSWKDGGYATTGTWPTVGNTVDYEFDCINLSRIRFAALGNEWNRYCRNCDVTVYIDSEEVFSKALSDLGSSTYLQINFNENGTDVIDIVKE